MAPQVRHRRQSHIDPLGLVLASMSLNDQVIIAATAVGGYSDRALIRLLPSVNWFDPCLRPRRRNPRRRVESAYGRLGRAVIAVEFDRETDRKHVLNVINGGRYARSPYVRELCVQYGIDSDATRRCAAPDCDEALDDAWSRRGGRPRETCSNACRQRLWRHRRALGRRGDHVSPPRRASASAFASNCQGVELASTCDTCCPHARACARCHRRVR